MLPHSNDEGRTKSPSYKGTHAKASKSPSESFLGTAKLSNHEVLRPNRSCSRGVCLSGRSPLYVHRLLNPEPTDRTYFCNVDTFPSLVVGGTTTPAWVNVRQTNNFNTQAPVTDVTSADFRCYDSATNPTAQTITVPAGSTLGIQSDGTIYHPGVVNVYMAKAPSDVSSFAGDGAVWFKVYEISAVTNGGQSISFPAEGSFIALELYPHRAQSVF